MRRNFDVDEMARLYGKGHTLEEVGRLLGCSPSLVYKRLAEAGYSRRTRGRPTKPGYTPDDRVRAETMVRFVDEGLTYRQVGVKFGVSRQRVHHIVKKYQKGDYE